jgi:hypothetical protein
MHERDRGGKERERMRRNMGIGQEKRERRERRKKREGRRHQNKLPIEKRTHLRKFENMAEEKEREICASRTARTQSSDENQKCAMRLKKKSRC